MLVEAYTVVLPRVFISVDPAWVTVTVLLETPAPAIVTVAVLGVGTVFAEVAVTVIVPLFEPEAGATLSQSASSVTLQVVFDVILNVPADPEADPSEILVGDTTRLGTIIDIVLVYSLSVSFDSVTVPVASARILIVWVPAANTPMLKSFT